MSSNYLIGFNMVAGDDVTVEESQRGYSLRAHIYDKHAESTGYIDHQRILKRVCECYPESVRSTVRILDVAAGTGLVGKELKDAGFVHIDALDPNADMLQEAKDRGIYENYFIEFLTRAELDIPKGTYDGITGSGIYAPGEGHMPVEAIYEMIRLVKPGGYIWLATKRNFLKLPRYTELEPLMKTLEEDGKWRMLSCDIEPNSHSFPDGIYWTFQVL